MRQWLTGLMLLQMASIPFAYAEEKIQPASIATVNQSVSYKSLKDMVDNEEIDRAISLATESLKYEENSDIRTLLGNMYQMKHEYSAAAEQYAIVLKNNPTGYPDASIGLSNVYLTFHDYESAERVINEALNKNSSSKELLQKEELIKKIVAQVAIPLKEEKTQPVSYETLKQMAYGGKPNEAIPLAEAYLKEQENSDVRVLLARMLIWKKQYAVAREQLVTVLQQHPEGYPDASAALADLEADQKQYNRALDVVNEGLVHEPTAENLLEKKKDIASKIGVNRGIPKGPAQEFVESGILITETEAGQTVEQEFNNLIWLDKEYSYVSDLKQTWELTTLSYTRSMPFGSVIGRFNYAYRFDTYGAQYEIDLYPNLYKGAYLYMSYGYSQDTAIFPRNRTGLEGFFNLPEGFEFSLGMRTLHFDTTIVMYTGSVGKYIGNYWIAYRPYIYDGVTNYFSFRRYFSTADSYVTLTLGTGYGQSFFSQALPNTAIPSNSKSVRLDGQLPVTNSLLFTFVVENSLNDFPTGTNRTETDLELGFIWRY